MDIPVRERIGGNVDINGVQETVEKVEEILAPEKFNLVDAIKGKSYPEDYVRVFMDEDAAYRLNKVNKELEVLANLKRDKSEDEQLVFEALEAEAESLRERLVATSLKFTLRGRERAVYDKIAEEARAAHPGEDEDEARAHAENVGCIAASLVSVENGQGLVDDHEFTAEEIDEISKAMPLGEWYRLLDLMMSLTFANSYFDAAVDAGFLSRR